MLSLKGTASICVNPWAAGDTVGNKHYHCWEWLDIDTASPTPTKPVTADWQGKRGLGEWRMKNGERWKERVEMKKGSTGKEAEDKSI